MATAIRATTRLTHEDKMDPNCQVDVKYPIDPLTNKRWKFNAKSGWSRVAIPVAKENLGKLITNKQLETDAAIDQLRK